MSAARRSCRPADRRSVVGALQAAPGEAIARAALRGDRRRQRAREVDDGAGAGVEHAHAPAVEEHHALGEHAVARDVDEPARDRIDQQPRPAALEQGFDAHAAALVLNARLTRIAGQLRETARAACGTLPGKTTTRPGLGDTTWKASPPASKNTSSPAQSDFHTGFR